MHILLLVTDNNLLNESAEGRRMTVEIISWSISTKVWDRTGIKLATPRTAVRHASVDRHVTNCATRPDQDGCLVNGHLWCVHGMIFAISESPYCCKPSMKFLFMRIYGLEEDVGWRIPRWLFSAWPSLMCEWDNITYFWISILPEAFHLIFDQENIWFGRRWWLKNSNMAV